MLAPLSQYTHLGAVQFVWVHVKTIRVNTHIIAGYTDDVETSINGH